MTSAPAVDERAHRDVIKAALLTKFPNPVVFDFGTVPGLDGNAGSTPRIHALLAIERRYVEPRRAGLTGLSGWRVSVRGVGRTPDEARQALLWATAALEENRLTVADVVSTPLAHESTTNPERDDDGWFSGLASWTYAL